MKELSFHIMCDFIVIYYKIIFLSVILVIY